MINVNFFEKKKINILPYIVGSLFFLFLLLMAGYFYLTQLRYENGIKENNHWLSDNAEQVVLSRQISQLDRLATESDAVQQQIVDSRYPMDEIIIDVVTVIPEEENRIQSFTLENPTQISVILEETTTPMALTIVQDLLEKDYVTDVQFLSAQDQNAEETSFRFEFMIDIDVDNLVEEETE